MRKIQLITFKGCQSTIDFRTQLEEFIEKEKLEAEVELVIVPSTGKAKEMGLFGSPTILVDGIEYQQERHGPNGFYWRAYLTAEGFRPYPPINEMASLTKGEQVRLHDMGKGSIGTVPILITADWCPFTLTANDFWRKAAQSVGLTLRVLDAESDEGGRIMSTINVAGVPCLVAAPGRLFYGLNISHDEAASFLNATP